MSSLFTTADFSKKFLTRRLPNLSKKFLPLRVKTQLSCLKTFLNKINVLYVELSRYLLNHLSLGKVFYRLHWVRLETTEKASRDMAKRGLEYAEGKVANCFLMTFACCSTTFLFYGCKTGVEGWITSQSPPPYSADCQGLPEVYYRESILLISLCISSYLVL